MTATSEGRVRWSDRLKVGVISCGGLGFAPFASGTAGTLGGVAVVVALYPFREHVHFGGTLAVLIAVGLVVGIALGPFAERCGGGKDPSCFVLDEVVGYWVALLRFDGAFPERFWTTLVAAFLAFRVFDVGKPPPTRRVEKLPSGYGIMLDDVVAGIYSLMFVWVIEEWLAS